MDKTTKDRILHLLDQSEVWKGSHFAGECELNATYNQDPTDKAVVRFDVHSRVVTVTDVRRNGTSRVMGPHVAQNWNDFLFGGPQ